MESLSSNKRLLLIVSVCKIKTSAFHYCIRSNGIIYFLPDKLLNEEC